MSFDGTIFVQIALAILLAIGAIAYLRGRRDKRPWMIVDGSNVMHWDGQEPRLSSVIQVVEQLQVAGFRPVVWFDANVGYKVSDRYHSGQMLSRPLGLPGRDIHLAPNGTPADPLLLRMARAQSAPVVSNDRFRDWHDEFPEILPDGRMVRGEFRDGVAYLNLIRPKA